MTSQALFYIIIGILVVNFVIDKILDLLNARRFQDSVPAELEDV
jgi:STE24 endopeptidase